MLGTADAADLLGVSYRQLDHFARTRMSDDQVTNVGSGYRRVWPDDVVNRLRAACAIEAVLPPTAGGRSSTWPVVAEAVLAAEPPPEEGWVLYHEGHVEYAATPVALAARLSVLVGAVVATL